MRGPTKFRQFLDETGGMTSLAMKLNVTTDNVQKGTESFSQDMEALKHNFLLRGYFRKLDKQQKKNNIAVPAPPVADT